MLQQATNQWTCKASVKLARPFQGKTYFLFFQRANLIIFQRGRGVRLLQRLRRPVNRRI